MEENGVCVWLIDGKWHHCGETTQIIRKQSALYWRLRRKKRHNLTHKVMLFHVLEALNARRIVLASGSPRRSELLSMLVSGSH